MKKNVLIAALLICSAYGWGKETKSTVPRVYPHFTIGPAAINPSMPVNSRLISQAYSIYDGTSFQPKDSSTYKYAFGRSGQLTEDLLDDNVNFEESITYTYNVGLQKYNPVFRREQSYDEAGKATSYAYQKLDLQSGNWVFDGRYSYSYDNDNKVYETSYDRWFDDIGWGSSIYYNNVFGATGNVVEMNSPTYRIDFSYDPDGRLTEQVEQDKPVLTGPFVNTSRTSFEYSGANADPDAQIIDEWNGSIWEPVTKESYTYNGTNLMETMVSKWNGIGWSPSEKRSYSYDNQQNKIACIQEKWDGSVFQKKHREEWTYNSFNQPLSYNFTSWDAALGNWAIAMGDSMIRFYYEGFDPTSVQTAMANNAVKMYPLPAGDIVHVDARFDQPQEISVAIYDIQGRVAYRSGYPEARNINTSIPVQSLPAGQYMVKVGGAKQILSGALIIVR